MKTYSLANIAVIYVDAGNDRNGNPRRGYMLVDSATGSTAVYQDEGYYGSRCLFDAVGQFRVEFEQSIEAIVDTLYARRSGRIRIAPSYRTHLLRNEAKQRVEAQIHERPLLVP